MNSIAATRGRGWLKDYPDFRDNTPTTDQLTPGQVSRGVKHSASEILSEVNKDNSPKIKDHLRKGLALIFGFTCYSSIDTANDGKIPFPDKKEDVDGGHAVMAVGFDDSIEIINPNNKSIATTGAVLIRNSWGTEWGENGYGWLPYEYVLQGIAADWWSMTKAEWVDTDKFGI